MARVEIWRIALDRPARGAEALSDDERARAARFHFERDRVRFIAAHAAMRAILGRRVQRAPEELRFSTGPRGKPALASPFESGERASRFNLAHSGERALLAICDSFDVGVDLEIIRDDFDHHEVSEHFFSPRERAALAAVAPELRAAAFFRCWAGKEAFIKATGDGLYRPLDSFDVALAPGEPAQLLATRPDAGEAARFTLRDLQADAGYAAALCVAGPLAPDAVIYSTLD